MTLLETIFRPIRLRSSAPTYSGTDFVCQKTCVKNRWVVEVSHASTSFDTGCGLRRGFALPTPFSQSVKLKALPAAGAEAFSVEARRVHCHPTMAPRPAATRIKANPGSA